MLTQKHERDDATARGRATTVQACAAKILGNPHEEGRPKGDEILEQLPAAFGRTKP
jgi:hypothetical protein